MSSHNKSDFTAERLHNRSWSHEITPTNKSDLSKCRYDCRRIAQNSTIFTRFIDAIVSLIRDGKIAFPSRDGYNCRVMSQIAKKSFENTREDRTSVITEIYVKYLDYVKKCVQRRMKGFKGEFDAPEKSEIDNAKLRILDYLKTVPYKEDDIMFTSSNTVAPRQIEATIREATGIVINRRNYTRYSDLKIYTKKCFEKYIEIVLHLVVKSENKRKIRDMQSPMKWMKIIKSTLNAAVSDEESDSDPPRDAKPKKRRLFQTKLCLDSEKSETKRSSRKRKRIPQFTPPDTESDDFDSELENESPAPGTSKTVNTEKSSGLSIEKPSKKCRAHGKLDGRPRREQDELTMRQKAPDSTQLATKKLKIRAVNVVMEKVSLVKKSVPVQKGLAETQRTPGQSCKVQDNSVSYTSREKLEDTVTTVSANDNPEIIPFFKAKDSTSDPPPNGSNKVSEENHASDDDIEFIAEIVKGSTVNVSNDSVGNKTSDDTQTNTNKTIPSVSESSKSDEKEKDSDKAEKIDVDENKCAPETTEEQSTVLPGQDDELYIIPHNLKVEITSDVNANKDNNDTPQEAKNQNESPSLEPTEKQIAETSSSKEVVITEDKNLDDHDNRQSVSTEISSSSAAADNVIDLVDESEVIKLEEITPETCAQCNSKQTCKIKVEVGTENFRVCSENCQTLFTAAHRKTTDLPSDSINSKYEKRCANCLLIVESGDDRNLSWETMEFCNEECLGKFQTKYGSYCRNCNGSVASICLGKYCVRFRYDVIHFCRSSCLEEFKKGLKVCSYCQKDISSGTDGFLAPVGDEGQFKDFCTQFCMEKYLKINSTEPPSVKKKACSVCQGKKIVHCEIQVNISEPVAICSDPCFAAFKFVNQVDLNQCSTCKKYFGQLSEKSSVVFHNKEVHTFCNDTCLNIFIITHRKIVPCNWCKVKKYNFDMIMKEFKTGQLITMCSLNCLTLYQASVNAVPTRRVNCNFCKGISQAQYSLTMSDAIIRNFCSYDCVMKFQSQCTKSPITIPSDDSAPVPTGTPKRNFHSKLPTQATIKKIMVVRSLSTLSNIQSKITMPVISSVTSLASNGSTVNTENRMTQCEPLMDTKSTQTDKVEKIIIPITVPIHNPTTRNTTQGTLEEIKRIQKKMPTDPFVAKLLMMAERVTTEKKTRSDLDLSEKNNVETETADSENAFGDNMLQMALKMATGEIEEPAVDSEKALTPNTIIAT